MKKNHLTLEDEKMLESLKYDSAKKCELILAIMFFYVVRNIISIKAIFILTFLIFAASWGLVTYTYTFNLFTSFMYLACHFIFFKYYIEKEYEKSIKSMYYASYEAVEILKIRLKAKLYI